VRILLTIHHGLERSSGAPGTTLQIAETYRSLGHAVRLCSYEAIPARGRMPVQVQQLAFPFVATATALRLWRWAEVVDASSADLWPLLALRRQRARRGPVVLTRSHGLEHGIADALRAEAAAGNLRLSRAYPLYHGGWRLREVAISLRRADAAFFLNDEDREYAVSRLGLAPELTYVMDNGLAQPFVGLPPPRTGADPQTVVQVGSFSPRKGIAYSVPAITRVLSERPAVRALLLGTGVAAGEVLAHFPAALRSRITVVERYAQEDLPALLAGASVGLFASVSEGFGKTLLEAMACGLAAVAASAAGPRRIVADGTTGVLVPVRDATALAAATLRLLDDDDLRLRLARAAHAAAQRYTWEATARERLAVYARLLSARSRPALAAAGGRG
jgi:glycosyltransferase involved in cell wall biosynthesis